MEISCKQVADKDQNPQQQNEDEIFFLFHTHSLSSGSVTLQLQAPRFSARGSAWVLSVLWTCHLAFNCRVLRLSLKSPSHSLTLINKAASCECCSFWGHLTVSLEKGAWGGKGGGDCDKKSSKEATQRPTGLTHEPSGSSKALSSVMFPAVTELRNHYCIITFLQLQNIYHRWCNSVPLMGSVSV